jgi:hypothetical protein
MSEPKEQHNVFSQQLVLPSRLAVFAILIAFALSVQAQETDKSGQDHFDVRSSVGDLHLGNDADARTVGLPLYPGARRRPDEKNSSNANLAVFTEAFGAKLVIARYDSDDSPGKIVAYYREKLKKYGKVIECRSHEHDGDIHVHTDKDSSAEKNSEGSSDVKCDGDNAGNVIELKTGTEDNQHVVGIEAAEKGTGSTFALVYVHTRGKQGDI